MIETLNQLISLYGGWEIFGAHLTVAVLILCGAFTNAMAQWKAARDREDRFDGADFLIAITVASFSGVMFTIGASFLSDDTLIIQGSAGAGAFLGLKGLNHITDTLLTVVDTLTKKRVEKA